MVPPRERRAFLIEQFARQIQKVEWQPATHIDPLALEAQCSFTARGDIRLADIHWSSGSVAKLETGDHFVIYRERQQAAWYELKDGSGFHTVPGALVLHHEETFSGVRVSPEHDFSFQLAAFSPATFSRLGIPADPGRVAHLPPDAPFLNLLSQYFADWCRVLPELDDTQAETAMQSLVRLLAVATTTLDPRDEEAGRAVATARVHAAKRFIAANLTRTDLSPDQVATFLGISIRQLHLDFEPTGLSVARRILAGRVELAKRLLLDQPDQTIIETAFASGFDGVSTFYRAFKSATGFTATEFRELGRQGTRETR